MTKIKLFFVFIFIFYFQLNQLYAQGCSDAGFCTMNSLKPHELDSSEFAYNQLKIGSFFGNADNAITVFGANFDYHHQWSNHFGIDIKLTTLAQSGNGIATNGLSDIFINTQYKIKNNIQLTFGGKIPLSTSNKTKYNIPLPMDYQSTLGTFDLIFGLGFEIKKIQIIAAIQQPLIQNNNQFLASNFPIGSNLRSFQSTNKFERAGDIMLRLAYPIPLLPQLKLTPSLLPIYHITNDKFTNEFNVVNEINGSKGLTLNGNLFIDFNINDKNALQFNFGIPFIVRQARPDGLTRSYIANLEYQIKF